MIGPTLGTGLFVGSGQALAAGGPASLLISHIFISVLVYCLTTAVAEISAHMPEKGGTMVTHAYRYSSSHLAFSMGYLRWYSLALLVPFEVINAIVHIGLWIPGSRVALRVSLITAIIIGFNMLPEKAFKRSETVFTGLKFITTIGLAILSFALSGVPSTGVRGFDYWNNPGAMKEFLFGGSPGRFLGLVHCLVYSTVCFIFQPELMVNRAEEMDSEVRPSILRVAQVDSFQLFFMYILSSLAIGLMSPFDDPLLTNHGAGAGLSPYMVGINKTENRPLHFIGIATILLSSVASGRSFLYLASRTLCTLSESGHAPASFQTRTRWGVPYVAVLTSALFSPLAYLSMATSSSIVFNWLMQFITTSGYISWLGACVSYLQFRRATETSGFTRAHQARIQPYGSYFGIFTCILLSLLNGLTTTAPSQLISVYIGIPTFMLLYFGHQITDAVSQRYAKSDVEQRGNMPDGQPRGLRRLWGIITRGLRRLWGMITGGLRRLWGMIANRRRTTSSDGHQSPEIELPTLDPLSLGPTNLHVPHLDATSET